MDILLVLLALVLGLAGAYYMYDQQQKQQAAEAARLAKIKEQEELEKLQKKPKPKRVDITAELKKKQAAGDAQHEHIADDHPWLRHILKGHKYGITAAAYSPNGRFIATSSTDRTVRIYLREALTDPKARPQQISLEYDHVTAMNFSSDGRTLILATVNGNIKLYQKLKAKPELVTEFAVAHKTDVHSVLMNDIGKWATIVTCASDADTDVKFWSTDGTLLQVVNTNQVTNYHCLGSRDNRYIAVAAYTPEVKILEITREKNGTFKKAHKIMSLQGHRTGVMDLAFNGSDTQPVNRVVTTCKDGSLRLWDINVRYALQEDPKVVKSFSPSSQKAFHSLDMEANAKVIVAARERDLVFLNAANGNEFAVIEHAFEDTIKRVMFSPSGDEVLVLGKNAKHIKIYKTPAL
ncbi:hypothetical protein Poli38472_008691 [Pythium oligandrum]|uniref:Uncharacterized protein n=1 Tax=Pythium oligandrum TaxID=41045 RepID=A0A8K1C418_PYTOL|nr:hypothetical protein Poli38472_008691 [Pythium oligandrum]|eukprot:TMW56043.1 hypothetical protein Poli38472_008691 [Pythium oligandrum]